MSARRGSVLTLVTSDRRTIPPLLKTWGSGHLAPDIALGSRRDRLLIDHQIGETAHSVVIFIRACCELEHFRMRCTGNLARAAQSLL